jgi:hypothetical protein
MKSTKLAQMVGLVLFKESKKIRPFGINPPL